MATTSRELQGLQTLAEFRPRTDDDLHNWVKVVLGVDIPRTRVCPHHSAPFEAFAHAYFARDSVVVWKASRGFGGKSFLLALLSLTEQITLGASLSLLGGSGEQAQRVHDYLTGADPAAEGRFWEAPYAPRHLIRTDPTKRRSVLNNGGNISVLTASQKSVRGPHPQRLRLDEVDEMDIALFDAAMGQTMEGRGIQAQTVCSSTHQYPDATMSEVLRRATEHGWPVFEWCYHENIEPIGWLPFGEIERKRREVPASMWQIEYELQEPTPQTRAIDSEKVKVLFDPKLGKFPGRPNEPIIMIPPKPRVQFYHGTDWAKAQDWMIAHTVAVRQGEPDRLAAWLRTGRRPWPQMIDMHNKRVKAYGGSSAHDVTGVGGVCADFLEVDSYGFEFANKKRRDKMISDYVAAIENGDLIYPMIDFAYREHLFATTEELYGSKHLPDSISAASLAWFAKRNPQETSYYTQRYV